MTIPDLDHRLEALLPELRVLRHDLHRHPELGFEEHRTQGVVRQWLEACGLQPRPSAETGLVVEIGRGGPILALRADMDALPMTEHTEVPYRSVHRGVAHKCGHDGHTAILMGVAKLLAERSDSLPGGVRLLFQPAEEGVRGGGARVMVEEGALEGVRESYGLHSWPGFPKGEVRVAAGPVMAQVDTLRITVEGRGGHGAMPQRCLDPIVAGAHVVTAVQSVVARGVGSHGVAVVTIGAFHAGTTHNVIPHRAEMLGTVRTFDPALREDLLARLERVVGDTAAAHGTRGRLEIEPGYPVLVNDECWADEVRRVGAGVVGAEHVVGDELPLAAAEDFAYLARTVPSAYFFLGAGAPVGETPGCHHPDFDFDDDLLATGVRMFCGLVGDRLRAWREA